VRLKTIRCIGPQQNIAPPQTPVAVDLLSTPHIPQELGASVPHGGT